MTDAQRHVHYVKVPFMSKLFYVGVGALLCYFAYAGGCSKVKSMLNRQSAAPSVTQCAYVQQESIDDKVR